MKLACTFLCLTFAAQGVISVRADLAGFAKGSYTTNARSSGGFAPLVTGNSLTLTSAGQGSTATSVFFNQTQNVSAFTASFDYHLTPGPANPGDGFAFVLQNDSLGSHALGSEGNGLGYASSTNHPGGPSSPFFPFFLAGSASRGRV